MKKTTTQIPLVRTASLGCAKNFVDTEIAAASLVTRGFGLTGEDADADIYYINTCAFLKSARDEAEKLIRQAEKWKKKRPGRKIIVGGCVVAWDTDGAFRAAHPAVDAWAGIHEPEQLGAIAEALQAGNSVPHALEKPYIHHAATPRLQLTPRHYAYLKIADGCDNRCAYCKIPDIRGTLRSRTTADVVEEAKNLLANGVRELIVIAQDTAAFGRDLDGRTHLAELLKKLDSLPGEFILRLMYLHPASVDDALLNELKKCRHLVKCLEMPLQHASTPVLAAMRRRITGEAERALVRKLRFEFGFAIRTTFMVGFPGETDEDFQVLMDLVKEAGFTRLGAFVYSREAGVPAADMADQVPKRVAEKRLRELMELQAGISLEHNRALIGRTVDVILDEAPYRGKAWGRTFDDAPEIDNRVLVSGLDRTAEPGDFVRVAVTDAAEYEIAGRAVQEAAARNA